MNKLSILHQKAMEFCDKAFYAKQMGDIPESIEYSRQALELEKKAAGMLKNKLKIEPTRSVLYRSAASIALECNETKQAEELIKTALEGNPPPEIKEELESLRNQAKEPESFMNLINSRKIVAFVGSGTSIAKGNGGSRKKRMTQTEIFGYLANKTNLKRAEVIGFFNNLRDLAVREIKKNDEFYIPGLGKLVKTTRRAREGLNPITGKPIKIPAKTTVNFRVGKALKDSVA